MSDEKFPAWIRCPNCDGWFCTIHRCHTHDPGCTCPEVGEWDVDPYSEGGEPMTEEKDETLAELISKLPAEMPKVQFMEEVEWPVEVETLEVGTGLPLLPDLCKPGTLVRVRPIGDDNPNKETYTGLYLGDLYHPAMALKAFLPDEKKIHVLLRPNPAIFVVELGRIVWGFESWWGPIKKEEDRGREITDECIQNQPVVQLLKSMGEAEREKEEDAIVESERPENILLRFLREHGPVTPRSLEEDPPEGTNSGDVRVALQALISRGKVHVNDKLKVEIVEEG